MTHEYTIATGGAVAPGSGAPGPGAPPPSRGPRTPSWRPARTPGCGRCRGVIPPSWTSRARSCGATAPTRGGPPRTGDPADLLMRRPGRRRSCARVVAGASIDPDPLPRSVRGRCARTRSSGRMVRTAHAHPGATVDLDRFARQPLLFGPSPLQPLRRLSAHLGGEVEIWAKREDCNCGLAFGGNKVRKLEYLAADALAQGADTLVSIGGVQSQPHARRSRRWRRTSGMKAVLVQEHWVEWPDAVYDKVGNILLSRLMGADVRLDRRRLRHRLPAQLGAGARVGQGGRRHALRDPGRRVRPPARRPRLRELGDGGRAPGAGAGHLLRHDHRVLGHRAPRRRA